MFNHQEDIRSLPLQFRALPGSIQILKTIPQSLKSTYTSLFLQNRKLSLKIHPKHLYSRHYFQRR